MSFVLIVSIVGSSCFLLFCGNSAFAAQTHITGKPGDDVTLQCRAPRAVSITVLEWSRSDLESDDYVFFYRNERSYDKYQHQSYRGRVELKDPQMKDGDVSVILKNVSVSDSETYECRIIVSSTERYSSSITLKVDGNSGDAAGNTEDEGKTAKVVEDGGREVVNVGLVAGVSALVLCFIGFLGFIIFKKHHKPTSYQPPPEKAGEQQQV
ncbi:V-set domain containing T-cell activation inhibitor 1-like [Anabas testudineus]|uniref:V-set domain containing T-cell activation inhibitor 1-like n=1 Tax=Anabas testudineus TaxID=64144 RepID=UPI000E4621F5|nr:V-set domain containing T-cell activation inhibitor 1-like [Anabas testudineus]